MAKYLIRVTEQYRVDDEFEAKNLIEESKNNSNFTLNKYSSEYKCKKVKGEIEDEWYRVTLVKDFTDERNPTFSTTINYDSSEDCFPEPTNIKQDNTIEVEF